MKKKIDRSDGCIDRGIRSKGIKKNVKRRSHSIKGKIFSALTIPSYEYRVSFHLKIDALLLILEIFMIDFFLIFNCL